ncbi:MAG: alpha/beta hydrolase family protein [Planctomycetota bacterium]|jgi:hypothetical protein
MNCLVRSFALVVPLTIVCGPGGRTPDATAAEAGKPSQPQRQTLARSVMFDADMVLLEVAGHKAFILEPTKPAAGSPKPWVWYAPTLLAPREREWKSPGERHAWLFGRLLASGVYVAGIDVGESWGSPQGRAIYDEFYGFMVERLGCSPRASLMPVSRGGLMAYNWAAERPEAVGCIGGIYPLVNLRTYSGIGKVAEAYGMSLNQLRRDIDKHNPVDLLRPLAEAGVTICHVQGDEDRAVPLETNSGELVRRYRDLGGRAEMVVIPGKGHEVAPELWQEPRLAEFLVRETKARARSAKRRQ